MDELINTFLSLNPIWVIVTIIAGLIIGFTTHEIEIDKRTIYLLFLYYAPFAVSRLIVIILFGSTIITSGLGYVGVLLLNIYILAIIAGRKIGRRN